MFCLPRLPPRIPLLWSTHVKVCLCIFPQLQWQVFPPSNQLFYFFPCFWRKSTGFFSPPCFYFFLASFFCTLLAGSCWCCSSAVMNPAPICLRITTILTFSFFTCVIFFSIILDPLYCLSFCAAGRLHRKVLMLLYSLTLFEVLHFRAFSRVGISLFTRVFFRSALSLLVSILLSPPTLLSHLCCTCLMAATFSRG